MVSILLRSAVCLALMAAYADAIDPGDRCTEEQQGKTELCRYTFHWDSYVAMPDVTVECQLDAEAKTNPPSYLWQAIECKCDGATKPPSDTAYRCNSVCVRCPVKSKMTKVPDKKCSLLETNQNNDNAVSTSTNSGGSSGAKSGIETKGQRQTKMTKKYMEGGLWRPDRH